MNYDRLCEAIRLCEACPLGAQGRGVPGAYFDGGERCELDDPPMSHDGMPTVAGYAPQVMLIAEAPGGVEMAQGWPVVGDSGRLLHAMLNEIGLMFYYVSNVAKHQPPKVKGKQQAPDGQAVEACAPFLRAEFELVKPTKLILLGKTAAKLVYGGNFSMKDVVNTVYDMNDSIPGLVLYHPSYFLRSRTAPWVQKQVSEWKRAVRMFLGDRPPEYRIERVECKAHA